MVKKEVIDYVEWLLTRGYKYDAVKEILKKRGYTKSDFEELDGIYSNVSKKGVEEFLQSIPDEPVKKVISKPAKPEKPMEEVGDVLKDLKGEDEIEEEEAEAQSEDQEDEQKAESEESKESKESVETYDSKDSSASGKRYVLDKKKVAIWSICFLMIIGVVAAGYYYMPTLLSYVPTNIPFMNKESCSENWSCTDWNPVACKSGESQTRTCSDSNNCGTTLSKPAETQGCVVEMECVASWKCGDWSVCGSSGTQTRKCADESKCGKNEGKPVEQQSCQPSCVEEWDCEQWDPKICPESGIQNRMCTDVKNCGTIVDRPVFVQSCNPCKPNWHCEAWQNCSDSGEQTRECVDMNKCGSLKNKPDSFANCVYHPPVNST